MNQDRFTQLLALLVGVAALLGSAGLGPLINRQRREMQLSFDQEVGDKIPPKYALAVAALGSFRGLVVDALWYRAEKLKEEGKFFEANTLSQWITTLQPRFPKVWGFHAWNMAYNISVATHTPEERWQWVNNGVRLLREQGIYYNPNAVALYRELGWILFHKMGQYSDDMHWYYKLRFCEEWQEVLGAPPEGLSSEQALQAFEPVAVAADTYFQFTRPSRMIRQQIEAFAAEAGPRHAGLADRIERILDQRRDRVDEKLLADLTALQADLQGRDPERARLLRPILEALADRDQRARRDPVVLLQEDEPKTVPLLEELRGLGLRPDADTLRRMGRLMMYLQYGNPQAVIEQRGRIFNNAADEGVLLMLVDPQKRDGMRALIAWLRARTLSLDYNMDPVSMYEMMELLGPLEWRHPAAHAAYWSAMGVARAHRLRNNTEVDIINTDRQVIHSLQNLMYMGRVIYDPYTRSVDLMPDPRFIPGYEAAVYGASARADHHQQTNAAGTIGSYESGHENFLQQAVVLCYIYGDREQARTYYRKLQDVYGEKDHNVREGTYRVALDDYVMGQLQQEFNARQISHGFVDSLLERAFLRGLGNQQYEFFNRMVDIARQGHRAYNEKRQYQNLIAERDRLGMAPFEEILVDSYARFIRNPRYPLLQRSRIYANSPPELRLRSYRAFRDEVRRQAEQEGVDIDLAFPAPAGFEEESRDLEMRDRGEIRPQETIRQR